MSDLPTQKKTTLVEIDVREGLLYVKFVGPQVGQRESPIISQEVEPYIRAAGKGLKHFIIDLKSVTFMSSMGLGMCIAFRNTAAAAKADSILFGLSKELLGLLSMMKIEKLYKIAKDQAHLEKLLK